MWTRLDLSRDSYPTGGPVPNIKSFVRKLFSSRFIRFLLVGVLNTIFGYTVFAFCLFLGLHYALAILIATIIGTLFNFKTTGKLVFNNTDNKLLIKFIGVYVVVYAVNAGLLKFFNTFEINMYISGGIVIPIVAILSFALNRQFVFKE